MADLTRTPSTRFTIKNIGAGFRGITDYIEHFDAEVKAKDETITNLEERLALSEAKQYDGAVLSTGLLKANRLDTVWVWIQQNIRRQAHQVHATKRAIRTQSTNYA